MAFKDVLVHFDTYPDQTELEVVDHVATVCATLTSAACAVAPHVSITVRSNRVAEYALGLTDLARQEERRSLEGAQAVLGRFREQAAARGLRATTRVVRPDAYEIAEGLVSLARTRDLCVVPYARRDHGPQRSLAETLVFASGRPVLILPPSDTRGRSFERFHRIAVAWDGSRAAARAVADAMPLLTDASQVRIITVLNDKPATLAGAADELARHLADHGVQARIDEVEAKHEGIGVVLEDFLADVQADLLVMGAYGHSRLREFVLGGATHSILSSPLTAVMMSH